MQVNVAGIRRNIKNFAHNYSDAQKKVREATSNDPWGPDSKVMAEIADQTYNVVAFSEIMQMVWKRLNDHGRNWRHVYKALVLLEYLIKTGSEKVGQQCKENIFAIQTLKDFEYLEEDKDKGQNVREKARQLVNLLKDDDRLRNERARALKAKERFAQTASGFGSDRNFDTPNTSPILPMVKIDWGPNNDRDGPSADVSKEIENARPQTAGEEELQFQLALAMSREEAEQEEQKRKSDDVRLQLALSQSQQDFQHEERTVLHSIQENDLLEITNNPANTLIDPWNLSGDGDNKMVDPWQPVAGASWMPPPTNNTSTQNLDPWANLNTQTKPTNSGDFDDIMRRHNLDTKSNTNQDNGNLLLMDSPNTVVASTNKKTPHSFLGENSALVNLDNLISPKKPATESQSGIVNPFSNAQQQHSFHLKQPIIISTNPTSGSNCLNNNAFGSGFGAVGVKSDETNKSDPWSIAPNTNNTNNKSNNDNNPNPFLS